MICAILVWPWAAKSYLFLEFPYFRVSCVDALAPTRCICKAIWEEPRALIRGFLPPKNPVYTKAHTYTYPWVFVLLL